MVATAAGLTICGLTRNNKKDEKLGRQGDLKNDAGLPITAKSIINLRFPVVDDDI